MEAVGGKRSRSCLNALAWVTLAGCLALGNLVPARADETAALRDVTFNPIQRNIGGDLGVGYRGLSIFPGQKTTFWVYAGVGYEGMHYYRDFAGNLVSPGEIGASGNLPNFDPSFTRIEGAWRLGIEQGIAWNERTATNLLAAFFFYRGRYDLNSLPAGTPLSAALNVLPDGSQCLLNTVQLGLGYDDLLFEKKHKTKDGISAEATAEWGPGLLFNRIIGNSDFVRFNGTFQWFKFLYDFDPDHASNVFSLYLGENLSADYALALNGTQVPLYIRQSFGGRNQSVGLGGSVRGVDEGAYDTNFKAVNNLEIRANLPAIFHPDLVPGLVVFLDAGAYDQLGEPGISSPGSGFVAGTGAGVYVDVLDQGSLTAYLEYRLDAANAEGDHLRIFVMEFKMHF
jgi:hypothetical protein